MTVRGWFVAALAIAGVSVGLAVPPRAWAETAPVQSAQTTEAQRAPSSEARSLADALLRPLLEGINQRLLPQMGSRLLDEVDNWEGWPGWRPRPGSSRSDVERVLVAVLQEAQAAHFDDIIDAAALELEIGLSSEDLIAAHADVDSPVVRSMMSKVVDYAVSRFSAPTPPSVPIESILTPEEAAAMKKLNESEVAEKLGRFINVGIDTALSVVRDDAAAIEAEFRKRACKFVIAPACADL